MCKQIKRTNDTIQAFVFIVNHIHVNHAHLVTAGEQTGFIINHPAVHLFAYFVANKQAFSVVSGFPGDIFYLSETMIYFLLYCRTVNVCVRIVICVNDLFLDSSHNIKLRLYAALGNTQKS